MSIEPLAIGVCSWSLQVKSVPELKQLLGRVQLDIDLSESRRRPGRPRLRRP